MAQEGKRGGHFQLAEAKKRLLYPRVVAVGPCAGYAAWLCETMAAMAGDGLLSCRQHGGLVWGVLGRPGRSEAQARLTAATSPVLPPSTPPSLTRLMPRGVLRQG